MPYNEDYINLIQRILEEGMEEKNKRTGSQVSRLIGECFKVDLKQGLPLLWVRKTYPKSMAAELAWSLSGDQSTEWLNTQSKIWQKFEDAPGIINQSYGHLWRNKFGRDQILEALWLLKTDPTSRQNLILAWNPAEHGLKNSGKFKNVPCPFGFQLSTENEFLNIIVYIRSSDFMLGFPYDVGMYSLLCIAFAKSIGLKPNIATFMLGDVHLYENQFDVADEMILKYHEADYENYQDNIKINSFSIERIIDKKDNYVKSIIEQTINFKTLNFNPKMEVKL